MEHTCYIYYAVFQLCPAVKANPLGVLGLVLVDYKLSVLQLLILLDVPLAIRSA